MQIPVFGRVVTVLQQHRVPLRPNGFVVVFVVSASILVVTLRAASISPVIELESASLSGGATVVLNAAAAGGKFVRFTQGVAASPTPSPTLAPTPTPTATPAPSMMVSLNEAGFGAGGAADVKAVAGYARVDSTVGEPIADYSAKGVKVILLIPAGCPTCDYSGSGVSSINATTWATSALAYYRQQCGTAATCPALEVLNEPGADWFWGNNALSQANASAYAQLLQTTWTTFHSDLGSAAPKILASYDGGYQSGSTWGQSVMSANAQIGNYVDGWTVHPYGGTGDAVASALGNRSSVTAAHSATSKPVWVTEVGWPTATGQAATGDSLQWTEAQQAANIYNFITWARGTGYVANVTIFNYRDYGTTTHYGIERADGSKKPSYTALGCATLGRPQTCTLP